ncbi:hypothetical protein TNCV_3019481, partial [Trichonephila clavipes]
MLVSKQLKRWVLLDCKFGLLRDGAIRTPFQDGSLQQELEAEGLHQNIGGGAQSCGGWHSRQKID